MTNHLFDLSLLHVFDRAKETNIVIWDKIEETTFADTDLIFSKKNNDFIEEGNPSEKFVMAEENLDGIDIDDLGNLEIHLDLCSSMRNVAISSSQR